MLKANQPTVHLLKTLLLQASLRALVPLPLAQPTKALRHKNIVCTSSVMKPNMVQKRAQKNMLVSQPANTASVNLHVSTNVVWNMTLLPNVNPAEIVICARILCSLIQLTPCPAFTNITTANETIALPMATVVLWFKTVVMATVVCGSKLQSYQTQKSLRHWLTENIFHSDMVGKLWIKSTSSVELTIEGFGFLAGGEVHTYNVVNLAFKLGRHYYSIIAL